MFLCRFSKCHIDMMVEDDKDDDSWRLTGFYGEPVTHLKDCSWRMLRHLALDKSLGWLCLGDFNKIMWSHKKTGVPRRKALMQQFRSVVTIVG
ncbi:hypothetical protein PTKIN_Ptkin05aG0145800 [Pterospermum kingtungense]